MDAQSKAYVALSAYVAKVSSEVRQRLGGGKVPTPEQLANYVKQVVEQLQKLVKGAPRSVQDKMAAPFDGFYDFWGNSTAKPLSAQSFLGILEDLEDTFPEAEAPPPGGSEVGAPAPTSTGKGAAGGGKGGYTAQPAPAAAKAPSAVAAAKPEAKPAAAAPAAKAASAAGGAPNVKLFEKKAKPCEAGMRADADSFVPGQGLAKDAEVAQKTRRAVAPPISAASKRLPTFEKKDWIVAGIRHNVVTVISGDTGCGKSTLIPQLVCDAENLVADDKVVVCTQPRRVAAITLAEYVSKDRSQELGDEVGYQIRFINKFCETTRLIYATTAIVLRRLHSEPTLDSIGCLIIDEVHERDVYTDFLLLLLKEAFLNGQMPHLKIVLMSATLKADDFANYFRKVNGESALKPVHIPGRMFPVADFYFEDACEWLGFSPPAGKGGSKSGKGGKGKKGGGGGGGGDGPSPDQIEAVYGSIQKDNTAKDRPGATRCNDYTEKTLKACALWRANEVYIDLIVELVHYFHKEQPKGDGAVLIFLPGWGDITKTYIRLYQSGENLKLITLHSLMTPEQQHEAFERPPKGMRKVVLSTNIAEASVTIDDVVYVIDCGVRKERSFDAGTSTSSLDTKMVTKANAIQRRGRAGRVQEGLVVHLFPSYKFPTFEEFPMPQMLTSSMEEVVLQSKVIHGGSNSEITSMLTNSMAAPSSEAIESAVKLLKDMNCLTRGGELTVLGRATAAIPVSPCVAKFLLIAAAFRVIKPAACIAAFLSIKSPFQQTPTSENGKGDKNKVTGKDYFNKGFASDHMTMLQAYVEWRREVARGNGDEFCDQQGLSPETLDMAYMMTNQFVSFMVDAGYDGEDVNGEGDYGEVDPVKKGSDQDALVRAAMVAGFSPSISVLYRGQRTPYWYLESNEEVSPFRGSANADYQMNGADGEEWMVFSDAMKMGRFNSIMDSSLVFSPFVLLFARALMIDEKKGEIRFDRWYAFVQNGPWIKELLDLRAKVMPSFKEAIESRDLAGFSRELTTRIADFVRQRPIKLDKIEAVARNIDEEVTGAARKHLSFYEWPEDLGVDDEEEECVKVSPGAVPAGVPHTLTIGSRAVLAEQTEDGEEGAAVDAKGMTRGQRKRTKRRDDFMRRFEFVNFVQKQDEVRKNGGLADLGGLAGSLDEALNRSDRAAKPDDLARRPGRKVQAATDEREMAQYQGVLGFQAFQSDPLGALEQHLKNSLRRQNEDGKKAEGIASKKKRKQATG
ncbi:unnamed protein product [Polarella glacialis]|uniref:RNA helicase n=1 Tax=Polarella glacialis TaxID=89957 RepID=A0A813DLF1_POLGL|nr:unnamed protein product [Polarella glacialis]